MGLFSRGKSSSSPAPAEHTVIARYRLAPGPGGTAADVQSVYAFETRLIAAIRQARAGEFEEPQIQDNELVVCAYGPDGDRLFAAMEPVLRAFPARPAAVVVRYGAYDDQDAPGQIVEL